MSDDWSLKKVKYESNDRYMNREIKTLSNGMIFYEEKIINILHEKLIEDIDTIDCTDKSKLKKWEIIEEVLEIIDKRFGVE